MFTGNFLRNIIYQMYVHLKAAAFSFSEELQGCICLPSENIKFPLENAQWLFSIKWQKFSGLIELARIYLTVVMMYTNEANFPWEYVTESINPERVPVNDQDSSIKKKIYIYCDIYNTPTITPLIYMQV